MLRWTEPGIGEAIVDIVLSISEQTKKLHDDSVALASYSTVRATLKSFDEIGSKLDEVDAYIRNMEGHPGAYLRSMTNAFRYFARSLQGDEIPYDVLLANIQELPSKLIPESKLLMLQEKTDKGLTDQGYTGSFREKVHSWLEETLIPPEQVTKVAEAFMLMGKKGTLERIIGLPEEDGIDEIKSVKDVFWSGYSRYNGGYKGDLTFNISRPWSEPTFAQVLTHESYPGHQTFYCRWDYLYLLDKLPIEASYYMVNSPTNALFEGGPETALHFLGWDSEAEDGHEVPREAKARYAVARNLLDFQRITQTNACFLTNVHGADKKEAIDYMMEKGAMNEVEAQNSYRFFTDPIQKTYYPSYYFGRWMVGKSYDMIPRNKRQEYFGILYDTPHTTNTFINSIKDLTGKSFDPFEY